MACIKPTSLWGRPEVLAHSSYVLIHRGDSCVLFHLSLESQLVSLQGILGRGIVTLDWPISRDAEDIPQSLITFAHF